MTSSTAAIGTDAVSLITLARDEHANEPELLIAALDQLKSRTGEDLGDQIARQADLIAALATFAGALADMVDGISDATAAVIGSTPVRTADMLQSLALRWAARMAEGES